LCHVLFIRRGDKNIYYYINAYSIVFVVGITGVATDDIRGYIYWTDIEAKIIGRLDVRDGITSDVVTSKLF